MAPRLASDFSIFQICIKYEQAGDRGQKWDKEMGDEQQIYTLFLSGSGNKWQILKIRQKNPGKNVRKLIAQARQKFFFELGKNGDWGLSGD